MTYFKRDYDKLFRVRCVVIRSDLSEPKITILFSFGFSNLNSHNLNNLIKIFNFLKLI